MFQYSHRRTQGLNAIGGRGNRPLRVLRVGDGELRRGADGRWTSPAFYQYEQILAGFRHAGVDVQLAAFGRILDGPPARYDLPSARISVYGVRLPSRGATAALFHLAACRRALRTAMREVDIVWAMLPSMLGLLAAELSAGRLPCFTQLVGDPAESLRYVRGRGALSRFGTSLVRRAMGRADGAIFVSPTLARRYGADLEEPPLIASETRLTAAQTIWPAQIERRDECRRLLYVGRLSPEKGVAILLEAMTRLDSSRLTIVGEGSEHASLENQCRALKISGRVVFAGEMSWGDPLLACMRQHDLLVMPSLTEGMPLVLLEAMSQGLPVVASRVGGIPDVIANGVNGALVEPADADALAEVIRRIAADPDARRRFALRGLETAREQTADLQYGRVAAYLTDAVSRWSQG